MTEEYSFLSEEGTFPDISAGEWEQHFNLFTLRKEGATCARLAFRPDEESHVLIGENRFTISRFGSGLFASSAQMVAEGSTLMHARIEGGKSYRFWSPRIGTVHTDDHLLELKASDGPLLLRAIQPSRWHRRQFALTDGRATALFELRVRSAGNYFRTFSGTIRNKDLPLSLLCAGLYLLVFHFHSHDPAHTSS